MPLAEITLEVIVHDALLSVDGRGAPVTGRDLARDALGHRDLHHCMFTTIIGTKVIEPTEKIEWE